MNESIRKIVGHREVGYRILLETMKSTMVSLSARWADMKKYEDIQDYQRVIASHLPSPEWKVVGIRKRPFGVFIERTGFEPAFLYCTSKMYGIRLKMTK